MARPVRNPPTPFVTFSIDATFPLVGSKSIATKRRGAPVFIVGGGNSAPQASLHFAAIGSKVTLVVREENLKATISSYLVDRIYSNKRIEVIPNTVVTALDRDTCLRSVTLTNRLTSQSRTYPTRWLFLCIGGIPRTDWAIAAGIQRDETGYLLTGVDLRRNGQLVEAWPLDRAPYYLETNVPVFSPLETCATAP